MARCLTTGLIYATLVAGGGCARDGIDRVVMPVMVAGAPDSASQREYGCLASRMLTKLESEPGAHGFKSRDPMMLVVDGIPLGRVHRIARDCPEREERVLGSVAELRVMLPPDPNNHDPDAKNGMVVIETK